MKKTIISLTVSTLFILTGFSQHYEYTGKKFIQYFDGAQMDKTDVFSWTKDCGSTSYSFGSGMLEIQNAFKKYCGHAVNFDSTHLDLTEVPYVTFEAKATIDTTLAITLADTNGNHTSSQHKANLTTEWQRFQFQYVPGIWGHVDITAIKKVAFNRYENTHDSESLYIRYLAVGDTSSTITNVAGDISSAKQDAIVLYPNPVKNELHVSGNIQGKLIISDLTGKVIMIIEEVDSSEEIDVSSLACGMYIISCTTETGIIQKTFIKE